MTIMETKTKKYFFSVFYYFIINIISICIKFIEKVLCQTRLTQWKWSDQPDQQPTERIKERTERIK